MNEEDIINWISLRDQIDIKIEYIERCFYELGCIKNTSVRISKGFALIISTKLRHDDLAGGEHLDLPINILAKSNDEISKEIKGVVDKITENFNKRHDSMKKKQLQRQKMELSSSLTQLTAKINTINEELEALDS